MSFGGVEFNPVTLKAIGNCITASIDSPSLPVVIPEGQELATWAAKVSLSNSEANLYDGRLSVSLRETRAQRNSLRGLEPVINDLSVSDFSPLRPNVDQELNDSDILDIRVRGCFKGAKIYVSDLKADPFIGNYGAVVVKKGKSYYFLFEGHFYPATERDFKAQAPLVWLSNLRDLKMVFWKRKKAPKK